MSTICPYERSRLHMLLHRALVELHGAAHQSRHEVGV